MEIFKDKIYFKSIDSFFPRMHSSTSPNNYSADNVMQLSNINIFNDCKCNITVYMTNGKVFYVDVLILNQSEKKEDMFMSFLKIEKKLNSAFGRTLVKRGRLFWMLFESISSKRKINNAVVKHHLYEHFGFRESITIDLNR